MNNDNWTALGVIVAVIALFVAIFAIFRPEQQAFQLSVETV